ncbi:MAG TPA: hypothetical protein VN228_08290 [Pyrinomonadaceae bacterium]|nr:hypothetical protein [Pyrinomonadaceae bacterium]
MLRMIGSLWGGRAAGAGGAAPALYAAGLWARPGMRVTFRAELMPGRDRGERTFRVTEVLPSRRVLLDGFTGEHTASEFEPLR